MAYTLHMPLALGLGAIQRSEHKVGCARQADRSCRQQTGCMCRCVDESACASTSRSSFVARMPRIITVLSFSLAIVDDSQSSTRVQFCMRAIVIAADARQVSPRASLAAMHCLQPFSVVLQAWPAIQTSKSCPVRCYFIITIPTHAVCSLAPDVFH